MGRLKIKTHPKISNNHKLSINNQFSITLLLNNKVKRDRFIENN